MAEGSNNKKDGAKTGELDRFEDLSKKLFIVPKTEVDELEHIIAFHFARSTSRMASEPRRRSH
jgi:hypothetical protein